MGYYNVMKMKEQIIIREQYLDKIRPFYDSKYIKVITGIRRCGKSELLKQIIKEIKYNGVGEEHIIVLDLEGKSGNGIKTRDDLERKIDSYIKDDDKYYIFIDEVQHVRNFEEAIASIRVSYNCSLFVTGSNSKMLHGKMQDRLTGRAKEFEVYPFTYKETLEYKNLNKIKIEDDDFEQFVKFGGMPQRFEEVNEEGIRDYLVGLYDSIIEKDVYGMHKKINKNTFETVSRYIISTTGRAFSALSIAKYLKNTLSNDEQKKFSETVNNYAKYLEESYFMLECRPYYLKGKECLDGTKKYYAIDPGLRTALGNIIELDDTFTLEGIVYNELISRGYEVRYGKMLKGEIDFVAIKNNKKCLIQVAYSVSTEVAYNREYGAYNTIVDGSPRYVMTLDKKDTSHDGITHLNIIDFLTGKVDINLS